MRSCSFFQGTVILTVSSLLIKFLGFFYKIFLAQAMGAEGMGIYQLIFPVFAVCHSLTSSGLEVAISRFTARSRGHEQSDYLWAGLFLTLTSPWLSVFSSGPGLISLPLLCSMKHDVLHC